MNIRKVAEAILKAYEEKPETKFTRGWFFDNFMTGDSPEEQEIVEKIWKYFIDAKILDEEGNVLITLAQFYRLIDVGFFSIELSQRIPDEIPYGGFVSYFLIIEPLFPDKFAVSIDDKVEIVSLEFEERKEGKKKKEVPIIRIKRGDVWHTIEITDVIEDRLLEEIANYDLRLLERYLQEPPTTEEIFEDIKKHIRKYVDARPYAYELATLFIFQSWLYPYLNSVFYLQVKAPFQGGKTTMGRTVVELCRHGRAISSFTPASIGRSLEKAQVVPFLDEVDQQKAGENDSLLAILRSGQRRDAAVYERSTSDGRIQTFYVFGPKIFSVHSQIENALSQRSFVAKLFKTKNKKLAILNLFRSTNAKILRTKILAWFLSKGRDILYRIYVTKYAEIEGDIFISTEEGRKAYKILEEKLGKNISPRNVELAFNMLLIANILKINLEHFDDILLQKIREDEEYKETGILNIIRDVLVDWYENIKESESLRDAFVTSTGDIAVPYEIIFKSVNRKLKNVGLNTVSTQVFKGYLAELEITKDSIYKKVSLPALKFQEGELIPSSKKRVKMAFVFTPELCDILGVEYWNKKGGLDEFIGRTD